jgi:hypothetical protein
MSTDTHSIPEAAIAALRRGNKIEAIKLTREATSMGLKESKEAVETFLGADTSGVSQAFNAAHPKTGTVTLLIYVILVTLAIYWFFFRD